MSEFQLSVGTEMDQSAAAAFITKLFSRTKSHFLVNHGQWLYRGLENQWFILSDAKIIAYCAVIPVNCAVNGQQVPALWWVDLIVAPAFRGQGVQTIFDARVRKAAGLLLGFPNELAAKIHRKHQWGVREDGDMLLLPLQPARVKTIQRTQGRRGRFLRFAAWGLLPLAWAWRRRLCALDSGTAANWPEATASAMAALFERYKAQYPVTIYRDEAYCQWRYVDAPYHDELLIYRAGPLDAPTHCLVARRVHFGGVPAVRILDIIGDRQDVAGLRAVVLLSLQEAIAWGAAQVTVLNFLPELRPFWRGLGFVMRAPGRFCWLSQDKELMMRMELEHHWVLGDSDNDAPE